MVIARIWFDLSQRNWLYISQNWLISHFMPNSSQLHENLPFLDKNWLNTQNYWLYNTQYLYKTVYPNDKKLFSAKTKDSFMPSWQMQTNNKYSNSWNTTICFACEILKHSKFCVVVMKILRGQGRSLTIYEKLGWSCKNAQMSN